MNGNADKDEPLLAKVLDAVPFATAAGKDRDPLGTMVALTGLPVDEVRRVVEENPDSVDAALIRAEASGLLMVQYALMGMTRAAKLTLDYLEANPNLDPADAAELTKPLQRILDAHDRMKMAERDSGPTLVIDISRLPGVARALKAGPADVIPVKESPLVIDAPEPKYGASIESASGAPRGAEQRRDKLPTALDVKSTPQGGAR